MREFLLNSEELLDRNALDFLKKGEAWGLLPCHQIRFNAKVKLAYFTDDYQCLGEKLPRMTLDEICYVGQKILGRIQNLEGRMEISLENLVWDVDSIYLDSQEQVFCLCLPAVIPEVSLTSQIYLKRVYALLEEMVEHAEGGEEVCRQIEFQKEREFGNWENLKNALVRRVPQEDETLLLKSVNTTEPLAFQIRHDQEFKIGADAEQADGWIPGSSAVSALHAVLGWNGVCFFVMDLGSRGGTYLNDQRIAPMTQIPIGKGSILKFAECTFMVE